MSVSKESALNLVKNLAICLCFEIHRYNSKIYDDEPTSDTKTKERFERFTIPLSENRCFVVLEPEEDFRISKIYFCNFNQKFDDESRGCFVATTHLFINCNLRQQF